MSSWADAYLTAMAAMTPRRTTQTSFLQGGLSRPWMPLAPTFHPTMQSPIHPISPEVSRRSFLKASAVLAGSAPLLAGVVKAQSAGGKAPLMAYVGTFSSPLRDVLPTQVGLPPGNGRGI